MISIDGSASFIAWQNAGKPLFVVGAARSLPTCQNRT